MKKTLLLVIDALSPHVVRPAIERGELKTFAKLIERGGVNWECVSVFPSITHACLSSIATGEYPIEHGVIGTFWYEKDKGEIAYYGAQPWVVLNQGVNKFLEDLLSKWNEERLGAETVFEKVERAGKTAGSLNHLVYRSDTTYKVHQPFVLKLLPGIETSHTLNGPQIMFLGDFVKLTLPDGRSPSSIPSGAKNRFGMNDEATLSALGALAGAKEFPDLTIAYFPDNDIMSHANGPQGAIMALRKVDWGLEALFEVMGGIDRVLDEYAIFITGDHAQVDMKDGEKDGGIPLNEVLHEFKIIDAGERLDKEHELLVAPNLRTAFIYCDECTAEKHEQIVQALLSDKRIDQALWKADVVEDGAKGFVVRTAERGELRFWQGGDGENSATDDFGCVWSWEGSTKVLDFHAKRGKIVWGDYPNAFERIACGLGPSHAGHVWATAKLGHGFRVPHVKAHAGGGSHASLMRGDSLVPLIYAGLPKDIKVPRYVRIVDVAHLMLKVLGIPSREVGEPRFKEAMKEPAL